MASSAGAYCTELSQSALITALQAAGRDRAPHNRDVLINDFLSAGALTHAAIVARNRCPARSVELQYSAVGVDLSESVTFHG